MRIALALAFAAVALATPAHADPVEDRVSLLLMKLGYDRLDQDLWATVDDVCYRRTAGPQWYGVANVICAPAGSELRYMISEHRT